MLMRAGVSMAARDQQETCRCSVPALLAEAEDPLLLAAHLDRRRLRLLRDAVLHLAPYRRVVAPAAAQFRQCEFHLAPLRMALCLQLSEVVAQRAGEAG